MICILLLFLSIPHGTERWNQKCLLDGFIPGAPVHSTIQMEGALPAPRWTPTLSRQSLERTVVEVSGTIIAAKLELDGDYHLDFSDGTHTEVCEIPDPRENPDYSSVWKQCREWVCEHAGFTVGRMRKCRIPCTITGVRFFDKIHGQLGCAPNGVEIHPIMGIN